MILDVVLLLLLIALLLYQTTKKPSAMPPGSFGLPVVGSLPPRNVSVTNHFSNLKKKYGPIFTTKWGSRAIVVLADFQTIKKALSHADFQGREDFYSFSLFNFNMNIGVINSTGTVWHENRRFLLRHLRDLGMGKTRLEESIHEEAKMLVQYLEQNSLDEPTEIDWSVNVAVVNVIWQMLASKRYSADDEEMRDYNRRVSENFEILQGPVFLIDVMPWIANILPDHVKNKLMRVDVMLKNRDAFYSLCRRVIKEHEDSLDPENPRDMIDYYIMEMRSQKDDPETTFRSDYLDLLGLMGDMFAAGSETTSSTLRWMILYLAINPQVQAKIHKELDAVVAKDRLPSLDDRDQLAYTDAVLLDVMRLSSLAPTALPHTTTSTVSFEGYTIPKGTMVMPCLELCHRDPHLWDHPDELYPEHFLDKDGKLDGKKVGFMPFSIGRRQCLGESLARMELFLFASAILQRFIIEPPPGVTLRAETDPDQKLLNIPKPFKVVLRKRV